MLFKELSTSITNLLTIFIKVCAGCQNLADESLFSPLSTKSNAKVQIKCQSYASYLFFVCICVCVFRWNSLSTKADWAALDNHGSNTESGSNTKLESASVKSKLVYSLYAIATSKRGRAGYCWPLFGPCQSTWLQGTSTLAETRIHVPNGWLLICPRWAKINVFSVWAPALRFLTGDSILNCVTLGGISLLHVFILFTIFFSAWKQVKQKAVCVKTAHACFCVCLIGSE